MSTAKRLRRELAEYQRRKQPSDTVPDKMMDESYNAIAEDTHELERYVVKAIRSHAREAALSASTGSSRRGPPGPPRQEIRPGTIKTQVDAREDADRSGRPVPVVSPSSTRASIGLRVDEEEERSPSRTREAHPSPTKRHGILYERTFGDRVKDQGHGVYSEVGEWPAEARNPDSDLNEVIEILSCNSSSECSVCLREKRERANETKQSSSARNSESSKTAQEDVSQTPHVAEERSEPRDPRSATASEREGSRHSSFEGSPGPYKPVPPFGGPRSRRRPRRPRTQSPIR